jgi:uncharacterized protein YjbI with pentapeptide repeats
MMDEIQLSILETGVAAWNQWRLDHPGELPKLRCADLRGTNLTDANFTEADLSHVQARCTDFVRAVFRGADITGGFLGACDLTEAVLTETVLVRATLNGSMLHGALT